MKVAWFSELPLEGSVDRNYLNMRTEFAWFCVQNATHHNLGQLPSLPDGLYDIGILILPKNLTPYNKIPIVEQMQRVCKKYGFMQEGPSWYFQDLPLIEQMYVYNIMLRSDFVLCHNRVDKGYYEGLLDKPTFINPTLMITDSIQGLPSDEQERKGVIIGGNLVRWYGGFNSLIVAHELDEPITFPRMGRMQREELNLAGVDHLKYLQWADWMKELNKFKYAIHLNPNTIAGTFSLNTAFLKIPTIGNIHSDTQRICFPKLSVEPHDLGKAKELIRKLKEDSVFYQETAEYAKMAYEEHYSEKMYKIQWEYILKQVK